MNHPNVKLRNMPYVMRRARLAELRKGSASFRRFFWQTEGGRFLVTALLAVLIFLSLRDSLDAIWILAAIFSVSVLVEVALSATVVLPRAELEEARVVEHNPSPKTTV